VTNDAEALAEAAVRGIGIMMCTDWLVGRQIAQGELLLVLPGWTLEDEGAIHLVVPSNLLLAGTTRAFIDWITAIFSPVPPGKTGQADYLEVGKNSD
jgi:DNA-binding transcriptional LysR family regulator